MYDRKAILQGVAAVNLGYLQLAKRVAAERPTLLQPVLGMSPASGERILDLADSDLERIAHLSPACLFRPQFDESLLDPAAGTEAEGQEALKLYVATSATNPSQS